MKKLLFVNSSLAGGGSERVMTLLANSFSERGYDVDMVLIREDVPDVYALNPDISCVRFLYKKRHLRTVKRLYNLRKFLKSSEHDVIISFMSFFNIITLLSSVGLRKKIIISERADPRKEPTLYRKLEPLLYGNAYKVVFQTDVVQNMYSERIRRNSVVIPNPVIGALPPRWDGEREHRIVAAGRLTEQKNFSMLLKAFAVFHGMFPDYSL